MQGCRFDKILSSQRENALNCTLPIWKDKDNKINMHWAQQLYESSSNSPMPWCTLYPPLAHWLLSIFDSKRPRAQKGMLWEPRSYTKQPQSVTPLLGSCFKQSHCVHKIILPMTIVHFTSIHQAILIYNPSLWLCGIFLKRPLTNEGSGHTSANHPLTQSWHVHIMCAKLVGHMFIPNTLIKWVLQACFYETFMKQPCCYKAKEHIPSA